MAVTKQIQHKTTQKSPQMKKPTQNKKDFRRFIFVKKITQGFEYFWKFLTILVTAIVVLLVRKIYLFHTLDYFKNHKKGNIYELVIYSLPISVIFIAFEHFMHVFFDSWIEKYYLRKDKYPVLQQRLKKSFSIVKWLYSNLYYFFTATIGYYLIKDTKFMPWFWGGNGSAFSIQQTRYLEQATDGMSIYYCVQFGKHAGRIFSHVFIRPEGAYYQYLLHHSLSVFLITFSYMMDMWVVGIFIFVLHDASDIFLGHCRAYRQCEYRNPIFLNISYAFLLLSWVGFRIVSLSYCVYAIFHQLFAAMDVLTPIQNQIFFIPYAFMGFMLFCLLFMHTYWLYYIFQSFLGNSTKGKVGKHSYD